jgi:hypothetical protein
MTRGATGWRQARRLSLAAAFAAGMLLPASGARAIEALEGRVQLHGYTEMQVRALDDKFSQELDLSQWYNVLNLELEFDIAPDGFGPIDVMSAYVRAEGRYDAIYSQGFYMFPSVNTFGDNSQNLPRRLRDGESKQRGGVIPATDRFGDYKKALQPDRDPATLAPPIMNIPTSSPACQTPGDPNCPVFLGINAVPGVLLPDGLNVAAGGPNEVTRNGRESANGVGRGFPGFDFFFAQAGPDNLLGNADDPARYVFDHVRNFAFTFKQIRGPVGADTQVMGPWLPKNFVVANALNTDRGNPFRGRVAPAPPLRIDLGGFNPDQFGAARPSAIRYNQADLLLNPAALLSTIPAPAPGEQTFATIDLLDPIMQRILLAPGQVPGLPFDVNSVYLDLRGWPTQGGASSVRALLSSTYPGRFTPNPLSATGLSASPDLSDDFGGDFMGGVVPCADPTADTAVPIRAGTAPANPIAQCIESSSTGGGPGPGSTGQIGGTPGNPPNVDPGDPKGSYTAPGLAKMTGGKGERPFRPAPDLPSLGQRLIARTDTNTLVDIGTVQSLNRNHQQAQGLYLPSKGTVRQLKSGHLDSLQLNYDQVDRSWNRGQSQQNNKELKEAYVDVEVLDSRLWMRLGLQNIVWGKTELFRTTDQFNPQDLALSSLPSLEESRIALWSARFVYSLYDVGPLEDVRLEFATNLDQYQPSDLGACGEPYTPDLVCSLYAGVFAHSMLGVGVVGIDRPESPWKDFSDLEFGGRVEWRWDRFSFALTDFWGFSDFPNAQATYFYDRTVDTQTGRPLVGVLPGEQPGKCGLAAGERAIDNMNTTTGSPYNATGTPINLAYNSSFASHPFSVTPGAPQFDPLAPGFSVLKRGGVGTDPDCLRPGGAPGGTDAFAFDQSTLADTNALQNHHANQQIFAWICSGTVGIAAALDAGSCAWTIFSSDAVLQRQLLPVSFVESLTALMAGEQTGSGGPNQFMGLIANNIKGATIGSQLIPMPLASLNQLYNNPNNPFDRNLDGDNTDTANCDDPTDTSNCDLGGFDGFDGRVQITGRLPVGISPQISNFVTLDRGLTNEQRALLGCGPFYAERCDSSLAYRNTTRTTYFGNYGGLDFMNMEASALVQSWPGIEGTKVGDTTTSTAIQPGTVGWAPVDDNGNFNNGIGGPICTRFVMNEHREIKLPGCRGVKTLEVVTNGGGNPEVQISFEPGYLPSIDGCVIGTQVRWTGHPTVNVVPAPGQQWSPQLQAELALCNGAITKKVVPNRVFVRDANGNVVLNAFGQPTTAPNPACTGTAIGTGVDAQGLRVCNAQSVTLQDLPLFHPTAGCVASDGHYDAFGPDDCRYWMYRNLVNEFFTTGTAQLFQNELAAFSWNFLMFLTLTSCNIASFDLNGNDHRLTTTGGPRDLGPANNAPGSTGDPQCFDPRAPYTAGRCSISSPEYCTNVKGFLTAAGVTRNTALAGGNSRFGRRTFIWHSGGELTLQYQQRNVLGFSSDFAEDHTKTNWGVEFTWIPDVPFTDNDAWVGQSHSDTVNLTVSVDRPTFINFLNPNRTFFFNSQWFFNYITNYHNGYTFDGPFNVLFTFAMFTGYFQDRVQPQFVTVYDFRSQSGALLPSFQYRFTESFSVTVGTMFFFGRTELKDMPVREYAPAANRSGPNAYENGVDNLLSLIRTHDEAFMRLRWTF